MCHPTESKRSVIQFCSVNSIVFLKSPSNFSNHGGDFHQWTFSTSVYPPNFSRIRDSMEQTLKDMDYKGNGPDPVSLWTDFENLPYSSGI